MTDDGLGEIRAILEEQHLDDELLEAILEKIAAIMEDQSITDEEAEVEIARFVDDGTVYFIDDTGQLRSR